MATSDNHDQKYSEQLAGAVADVISNYQVGKDLINEFHKISEQYKDRLAKAIYNAFQERGINMDKEQLVVSVLFVTGVSHLMFGLMALVKNYSYASGKPIPQVLIHSLTSSVLEHVKLELRRLEASMTH